MVEASAIGSLPVTTVRDRLPRPLVAVFLLKYRPDLPAPEVHAIGPAEAGARLYANPLNAVAHGDYGIGAVACLVEACPASACRRRRCLGPAGISRPHSRRRWRARRRAHRTIADSPWRRRRAINPRPKPSNTA